jgi:hypothetical protein
MIWWNVLGFIISVVLLPLKCLSGMLSVSRVQQDLDIVPDLGQGAPTTRPGLDFEFGAGAGAVHGY